MLAIDCDKHSVLCQVCGADWVPGIRILDCDEKECGFVDWFLCNCAEPPEVVYPDPFV